MNKNTTLIIVLVALVLVGGGAFFFSQTKTTTPLPETGPVSGTVSATPEAGTNTITETDKGFIPSEVTVKKGETVTFKSTTGQLFWPASNPHPSHTIYPEFDPQEPIPADKTWSFTFEKVGTWHFHDHLAPYFTGTITVTE